jgi:hypothetical protein
VRGEGVDDAAWACCACALALERVTLEAVGTGSVGLDRTWVTSSSLDGSAGVASGLLLKSLTSLKSLEREIGVSVLRGVKVPGISGSGSNPAAISSS